MDWMVPRMNPPSHPDVAYAEVSAEIAFVTVFVSASLCGSIIDVLSTAPTQALSYSCVPPNCLSDCLSDSDWLLID